MSKVENPEEDDLLNKNNNEDDIEDEEDELDESKSDQIDKPSNDEDEEEDDKSKKSDPRATLNAQNRFLKAEGYEFVNGKWVKPSPNAKKQIPSKSDQLSTGDMIVLLKADVTEEEDIREVQDFAKFKNITVREAMKNPILKSILSDRAEERDTANATHTGSSRRNVASKSSNDIISDAKKGALPDDPAELARARNQQRVAKKKR